MGIIVQRHGVFYHNNFGFDQRFEALCARITADFLDNFNPALERCWIAEKAEKFMGCIMLVKDPEQNNTAKIRLLLVDESARGEGVGTRLVQQCVDFARGAGYDAIGLWTQSDLVGARRIYRKAGFVLDKTDKHSSWGKELMGEHWKMTL